jgi:AraC-like DNA-binding protein
LAIVATVDVIEAVIGSLRAGHAYGRRVGIGEPWGIRFPRFAGTGFHVVLAGEGWVMAGDRPPVALRPGDVVLVPHGAEHTLASSADSPAVAFDMTSAPEPDPPPHDFEFLCGVYRLERSAVHPFLAILPDVVVIGSDGYDGPAPSVLAGFVAHDVTRPRPGEQVIRAALVDLMVAYLLRQVAQPAVDAWPDASLAPALQALHNAPQRPWTAHQLGAVCNMSRTAFSRRFTTAVGQPPMTYLTRLRLAHGARLLRETAEPLDAIARKVGYSTGFAFAHAFHREYGLAPGHFRRPAGT